MKKMLAFAVVILSLSLPLGAVAQQAHKVRYEQNPDGTLTRLEAKGQQVLSMASLKDQIRAKEEALKAFDRISAMSAPELAMAHAVWERYREMIGKDLITIPQAVENVKASLSGDLAAMKEAAKK